MYSSKTLISQKDWTEELFPIKIDERDLLKALCDPGLTPLPKGEMPDWNMDDGLDESIVSMVEFLILITLFLFLGDAPRNIEVSRDVIDDACLQIVQKQQIM